MMLGRYLTRGLAGDIDLVEGRQWLERAVKQGITEAELELGTVPGDADADALASPSADYLMGSDLVT
jgi:TPR repeat protein